MPRTVRALALTVVVAITLSAFPALATSPAAPQDDTALLKVRETVWRAWFDGDLKTLEPLVPPDTLVISASEKNWKHQSDILSSSRFSSLSSGSAARSPISG